MIERPKTLLALLAAACLFGAADGLAQDATIKATPDQMVDAINGVFGVHPGARAVHAKGIMLEGVFTPGATASTLSKAAHLQKTAVPVSVRFSDFAGIPTIPDTDGLAAPRGMAIKFHLPDGSETDLVAHSFNGFPTATTDEFRALLIALGTSGPTAVKPTPLDTFLADHPIAKTFLEAPKPPPVSYATLSYFGVNSFAFTNAAGTRTIGRYQLRPVGGEQYLSSEALANAKPDYLQSEIRDRLAKGPASFTLLVQIAEAGDAVADPSIAWPASRRTVPLGTLKLTKLVADSAAAERAIVFLPGLLTDGIEAADPMIGARTDAYTVSFSRRSE